MQHDEEDYNDENEGKAIHFEEEIENVHTSRVLAMELCWKSLCPPNKEEIVGK